MAMRSAGQSILRVLGWCFLLGGAFFLQLALAIPTIVAQPPTGGGNPWSPAWPPPLAFLLVITTVPLVLGAVALGVAWSLFLASAAADERRWTRLRSPAGLVWGVAVLVLLPSLILGPLAAWSMLRLGRLYRREIARISRDRQFVTQRWSPEGGWSTATFSFDGQRVYTNKMYGSLRAWNAHTGTAAPQDIGVSLSDSLNVAISRDGQRIACIPISSNSSGKIIVYDRTGRLVAEIPGAQPAGGSFVFSRPFFLAGEKQLAFAYRLPGKNELTVGVWDIDSARRVIETQTIGETTSLAVSPDGAMFGVVEEEPRRDIAIKRRVLLFSASDLPAGPTKREWGVVPVRNYYEKHRVFYKSVLAIAPGGEAFAIAAPEEVLIHDAATGQVRLRLEMSAPAEELQFDLSDKRLVAVSASEVRIWNCASGVLVAKHAMPAHSLEESVVSPDLRTLIYKVLERGDIVFRMSLVTGKELLQGEPAPDW